MQPSISIDYNSQSAGGLLGLGFNLNGVTQAITRAAPTYEQDGFSEGIKFDAVTDRYALNGERLMATFPYTKQSGDYLANAAQGEFKTEQNRLQKLSLTFLIILPMAGRLIVLLSIQKMG